MDVKGALARLVAGDALSTDEARCVLDGILDGDASPAQIAAVVTALRIKGETVEELTGMLRSLVGHATPIALDDPERTLDVCGTGGNEIRRRSAFSVSTVASLVIAGAGGTVCKHGNRAASATCGSADTFEALGVRIELDAGGVERCVRDAGIGFVFARAFHPAMRHVAPVRAELGIPTSFNYVAPLANPARPRRHLLGVSDPTMARTLLAVLAADGVERAWVVHGSDGLDEITTTADTQVLELRDGEVRSWKVDPAGVGLPVATHDQLGCGDARANATLCRRILDGEHGPHRDIVLLNAAAGLVLLDLADDLVEGIDRAATAIDAGGAAAALERLVTASNA